MWHCQWITSLVLSDCCLQSISIAQEMMWLILYTFVWNPQLLFNVITSPLWFCLKISVCLLYLFILISRLSVVVCMHLQELMSIQHLLFSQDLDNFATPPPLTFSYRVVNIPSVGLQWICFPLHICIILCHIKSLAGCMARLYQLLERAGNTLRIKKQKDLFLSATLVTPYWEVYFGYGCLF